MNNERINFQEKLVEELQSEIDCAKALFYSLESESLALSSVDETVITINTAKKQRLIEALQQATESRLTLMAQQGLMTSPSALKDFPQSELSNDTLDSLFVRLSEVAQRCYTENRLIGQLINRRTRFISQTLNSLTPSRRTQELTYGKNGNTSQGYNSSTLYSI